MNNSKNFKKWLEAGYERFANEGPLGIQVERLARIVDLNKSGFYHYFGDQDTYITELIKYHYDRIHQFVKEASTLKTFDPEYLHLIITYKLSSMVQMQLSRHQNNVLFAKAFTEMNTALASAVFQLWADFINMPDNPELAVRYFQFVRSALYAKGNFAELTYDALRTLVHDAKVIVEEMIIKEQSSFTINPDDRK